MAAFHLDGQPSDLRLTLLGHQLIWASSGSVSSIGDYLGETVSSGKFKPHRGFNKTQIKDGWIVRLNKDGKIRSKLEPYKVTSPKK